MPKPQGLGPRLVAIQQAGITKEEAGKQITAQAAAGIPQAARVFTNPKTGVIVSIPPPEPVKGDTVGVAYGDPTSYKFLGIDITGLVRGWNDLMYRLGVPSGQVALARYKTNQWDGTVDDLAKGRR